LHRSLERAFPVNRLPEGGALVVDPRDDESATIAALCQGKTWSDLDASTLMKIRAFGSFATDAGFCALVPAFIHQSIVAEPEHRFELEASLVAAFEHTRLDSYPSREQHRAAVGRRIARLTPAQRWVVRELLRMVHRQATPPWSESEDGRFWESVEATAEPSIMSDSQSAPTET